MQTGKSGTAKSRNDAIRGVLECPPSPEESLVEAARRGHSSAFDGLCRRYTRQLLRATFRITRSHEDAEDAVQDALMRAFLHVRDFDARSSFATWLTRIAMNSALMILRKKRTLRETSVHSGDEAATEGFIYEIPDRAPNPERHYAQRQEVRILRKAIDGLRPTLRKAVEIQQLQERSMRETADVMGISVAATKARLFHAKLQLRKSRVLKMMHRTASRRSARVLSAA